MTTLLWVFTLAAAAVTARAIHRNNQQRPEGHAMPDSNDQFDSGRVNLGDDGWGTVIDEIRICKILCDDGTVTFTAEWGSSWSDPEVYGILYAQACKVERSMAEAWQ